jgi:hypothetical protein
MREQFRAITTNLTPVRVVGVPGLTLVLIAIALAMQFPEARWLIAAGLGGGGVIAAVLIGRRRAAIDADDGPRSNAILPIDEPRPAPRPARQRPAAVDEGRRTTVIVIADGYCFE